MRLHLLVIVSKLKPGLLSFSFCCWHIITLTVISFLVFSFSAANAQVNYDNAISLYNSITTNSSKPKYSVFEMALNGHYKLKQIGKLGNKNLLTIIDFSYSSNKRRLWIIDLEKKIILEHSLVAHGKNTGQEFATQFSNEPQSYKSSLGFYITGSAYIGKHGLSLQLIGVEEGFNDNAYERSIVMHGAKYVSFDFISVYGRLGRSYGCPAVPMHKHKKIINMIAEKTCLFIYYPSDNYLNKSKLID